MARDLLKWNDYCIHLFWEMLILAVYYLNPESVPLSRREDTVIDIECVTIFLVLHIPENQLHKGGAASGATSTFDSIWPLNSEGEVYPSSPVASPSSSPVRESNRAVRAQSPVHSPISPRSPRSSPQQPQQPGSPKRSLNGGRTPRGSTQYLHLVRVKIPLVLRALFPEDRCDDNFLSSNLNEDSNEINSDIRITKRMADAFGLVVCGGHSRDNYVSIYYCSFSLVLLYSYFMVVVNRLLHFLPFIQLGQEVKPKPMTTPISNLESMLQSPPRILSGGSICICR